MVVNKEKHSIIAILIFLFAALAAKAKADSHATDTVRGVAYISFPVNETRIMPGYENNKEALDSLLLVLKPALADSCVALLRMHVHGYGSPDGPYEANRRLAQERTENIVGFIVSKTQCPRERITVSTTAEDWAGLATYIQQTSADELPHRDDLLRIISSGRTPDAKEKAMMTMYPKEYRSMTRKYFPRLRRTEYEVGYMVLRPGTADSMEVRELNTRQPAPSIKEPAPSTQEPAPIIAEEIPRTFGYLRSNLLLPLLNVGFELPLGNRWSVAADWYYPWAFRSSSHKNCYQIDGLSLEGRYWFGSKHAKGEENKQYRLLGHSVSIFAMAGRYDLEHNYKGHQGEYILGGVDYLYAKPVFKDRMHLEFSFGIGFLYTKATKYEVFVRGGKGYRNKNFKKKIQYFGPVRASIALVLPLKWPLKKTFSKW